MPFYDWAGNCMRPDHSIYESILGKLKICRSGFQKLNDTTQLWTRCFGFRAHNRPCAVLHHSANFNSAPHRIIKQQWTGWKSTLNGARTRHGDGWITSSNSSTCILKIVCRSGDANSRAQESVWQFSLRRSFKICPTFLFPFNHPPQDDLRHVPLKKILTDCN